MKLRNRKGQFTHLDREAKTTTERKTFQAGVAELMRKNQANMMTFDVHCQPPSLATEAANLGAKSIDAILRGNVYQAGKYAAEAYHLAQLEASR
jgi:hypothetical protein